MRTAVIILNWNTAGYLESFLPSLLESLEGEDAELVVADNASTDGSTELLRKRFPELRRIELEKNFGFTGGYNRAVAQVLKDYPQTEYIVLINSDIDVPQGWLKPLIDYMDSHPACGVCGPKLHALLPLPEGGYERSSRFEYAGAAGGYLDRLGYPFCRGRVLSRTQEDEGQWDTVKNLMWVSGACLVTRSSLWKSIGGLDERFFAHMEEIDYCFRARREGYKVRVVPQSVVYHLGGGTLPQTSPYKLMLNYRNGLLMLHKNLPYCYNALHARLVICLRILCDDASALVYLFSGKFKAFKAVFRAHHEYRRYRRPLKAGRSLIKGPVMCRFSIVLQSLLRGKGIFDYLRRYENSH